MTNDVGHTWFSLADATLTLSKTWKGGQVLTIVRTITVVRLVSSQPAVGARAGWSSQTENEYRKLCYEARQRLDSNARRTERSEMTKNKHQAAGRLAWIASLLLPICLAATGCQVEMAGQTLPSPYYLSDDLQYYAPGPDFKLAREAAALKEQRAAEQSQAQGYGGAHCPE